MSSKYHSVNNLKVSEELLHFVNNELFDGTDISPDKFWKDFDKAVHELAPKNKELINFNLLNRNEKNYLLNYNLRIYSNVEKYLNYKEKFWLLSQF